jgi:lysophospholipase L1-like esterase
MGLLVASLIAALILCEIALRLVSPGSEFPAYCVWRPYREATFRPLPGAMPGIEGKSRFSINAMGMRGDIWPAGDSYRILAIGGSSTECLYLDDRETWPHLLQVRLNERGAGRRVWVGNVGKAGHNTRHHMLQVRELLNQYPTTGAIILLIGINDLHVRLARDEHYRPLSQERSDRHDELLGEAFALYPQSETASTLLESTEIGQRLSAFTTRLRGSLTRHLVRSEIGDHYIRLRKRREDARLIRRQLPDLSSALDEYAENVKAIIDLARARNTRPILVTQPVLWAPDLPTPLSDLLWLGGVGEAVEEWDEYYSVESLARAMNRYNDRLLSVCRETRADCIDLASVLQKDTTVFYDDCHFNESGAEMVAATIADYMLKRGFVPDAGADATRASP